ncbi:glycosyltransferase [Planktothricoides raciborskii]|uniref:Glycosyltransferase n=1 Tax=Planktothricoides raciborskii GIHE-MW2 TaxID=2792601 RepID=A0AAU8J823_9CYAN
MSDIKVVQSNKAYFPSTNEAMEAYFPRIGGIEIVVQQLAEGFAQQFNDSSYVVTCSKDFQTYSEKRNGVSIISTGTLGRIASLPISPSYPFHLLQQTGDILQLHEPFLLGGMTYLTFLKQAKKRFKRLVVWWHSDIIRQKALAPLYTPLLNAVLHEADAIIVATPKHITSSKFLGDFSSKCHVVHYGVDISKFKETLESETKAAYWREKYKKPIILFTGRLVYYKGVKYLVSAMENVPDAHLIIVGKGPLREELEEIAVKCPNNVSFIPFLSEEDLIAMYKACEIFVLPSVENSEGFGIVQIEAMSCGKPVITTDLETGVTYVNQHGKTGLVVPKCNSQALTDAINELLANSAIRSEMGEVAQSRVIKEFTVEGMVDKTLDVYNKILS